MTEYLLGLATLPVLFVLWAVVDYLIPPYSLTSTCGVCHRYSVKGPDRWATKPFIRWHQRKAHEMPLTLRARRKAGDHE